MDERESSKTALGVAVHRAVHQLLDATPRILDDPVSVQLVGPEAVEKIRANPARFQSRPVVALRSHVLIRSRYAEDRLAQAVLRGIVQFLSLGAGFDTFPYRQPAWAKQLRIFEIDHPATQSEKRAKLCAAGIPIPPNVDYVPIDFEVTSLVDGLRASHFDNSLPTFISWLGVMVYLSPEAADAVLSFVAQLPAPSEIVFTFSPPRPEPSHRDYPSLDEQVARINEPFRNHIAPEKLAAHLRDLGFTQVIIPSPEEVHTRYIQDRHDGLHASQRQTIASASFARG